MTSFLILWLGQLISMTGSALPAFAFEIHVFQANLSVTSYTLIYVYLAIPGILLSPFIGAIVDKYRKKNILLITTLLMALNTLIIYAIYKYSHVSSTNIYLFSAVNSVFSLLQSVALMGALTNMVSTQKYVAGNYLISLGYTAPRLFGPVIAGYLLMQFGLEHVLLIDLMSFLFVFLTILITTIPENLLELKAPQKFFDNMLYGFTFIKNNKLLSTLLAFSDLSRFAISIQGIYVFLIILLLGNVYLLGIAFTMVGALQIAGVVISSYWASLMKSKLKGIILISFLESLIMLLGYSLVNIWIIAVTYGLFLFFDAFSRSLSRSTLQILAPKAMHGRVISFFNASMQLAAMIAFIIAGPLADKFLIPLFTQTGNTLNQASVQGLMSGLVGLGVLYIILVIAVWFFSTFVSSELLKNVKETS